MKNVMMVSVIVLVAIFFVKNDAQALCVGDEIIVGESYTAMPFSKFQIGGSGDLMFEKKLDPPDSGGSKRSVEGYRVLAKPAVSVFEDIDLYVKAGIGMDKFNDSKSDLKIDTDIGVSYGGGLRANLAKWESAGIFLGMDAQYLRLDTGMDSISLNNLDYNSVSGNYTVDQWQISAFLTKQLLQMSFYGGGTYADSRISYDYDASSVNGNGKAKNDKVLGMLGGINVYVANNVTFFAEGHFINETSLALGLNARF